MVSPMPCCISTDKAAADETMPLEPMPASVKTQMQRVIATAGKVLIDVDQFLHIADLAGQDDFVFAKPKFLGFGGAFKRRQHDRFAGDGGQRLGCLQASVFIQQTGQHRLIQAAAVDADAYRFVVLAGKFDHLLKLRITAFAAAYVARIDAVFIQSLGAVRVFFQQFMAVKMEVADDRESSCLFYPTGCGFRQRLPPLPRN